jgi:hypothetical protein
MSEKRIITVDAATSFPLPPSPVMQPLLKESGSRCAGLTPRRNRTAGAKEMN